jgi:two-component system cell cycle sensor histidine kinase/response regulator CckA
MEYKNRTKKQLIDELADLRRKIKELNSLRPKQKHIEKALRESEEKYRLLVENADVAIFIAQDEVIKFPNPKALELIGYSADELAEMPFVNLIHPQDKDAVYARYQRWLNGEKPSSTYEFRIISKKGDELWVQLNTALIAWEGRPATLNFLRDITVQKTLEVQFQQAQKMEAIGTLAGGIAHAFNNILMAIQGHISLLLYDMDSTHPHYEALKNIEASVINAAKLTNQLLGYARKGKYHVQLIDLNQIVEETSGTFGKTRKDVTIYSELSEDLFGVEADQGQMEQVLLNLYVNAAEAMPDGGKLILKTSNATHNEIKGRLYEPTPGRYVQLTITDTGVGMDPKTQNRIFEPFFTTKELGMGTGLGLAAVFGIIKAHGGYIEVESEKGRGTTFAIYLPAISRKISKINESIDPKFEQKVTILLIDDEKMVLDVGSKMLQRLGYAVLAAGDGKEAIEIYQEKKNRIDMVILDMILPEINGGIVFDRIKEINPKAKVLLSSGYSIDGRATELLKRGCNGFIQKPFTLAKLSEKIKEILAIK